MRLIDLTGQTFGRLTVVERAENHITPSGWTKVQWRCRCSCGTTLVVRANDLGSGHTRSCGCLYVERSAEMGRANRIEEPGYQAAHARVYVARGPARDHTCVACGDPAQEWAYDHTDPNELTRVISGYVVPYSADPQRYQPMCKPCHVRFDRQTA